MPREEAGRLMRSAWARRRESFDAAPDERRRALVQARNELVEAADMLRGDAPVEYAHALHLLANVEVDAGAESRALTLWEEAVAVLRGADDPLQLAHKVRHLGDLHRHAGRLADAGRHYEEALSLYREHDGPGSLDFANAVARVAVLKEQQGDRDRALSLWRETRDLYARADVAAGVEEATEHILRLGGDGGAA